jgi:hypothetical protein
MGVCDLPLMSAVCDTVDFANNPAGSITNGIGAWIAESMGNLAASGVDLAAQAINNTTGIDLNAGWFRSNYELLMPIGLILTVGTFCLQLIMAAWRRDERALAQAAIGTMTGVLFSFCALAFTSVAVTVVDALSNGLFSAAHTSVADAVRRIIKVSELGAMYQLGWAIPALVALGSAIGTFMYWGVMVARKVGVLVLVTLAIFAGAGGGWEAARRWRRGWIEATATLVVSKLLMTIVFLLGVSAIGQSESTNGASALSDALAGLTIMVLILLCPYATYKFVHWASDGSGQDDLHRSAMGGVSTAAGAARTAGSLAMQFSGGGGAPQGPAKVPGMDGDSSGIDPSGSRLSKEGIDPGPERPQTRFRFGEDTSAGGDRSVPLVKRPGIPPLITRPGNGSTRGTTQQAPGADGATAPTGPDVSQLARSAPMPPPSSTPKAAPSPSFTLTADPPPAGSPTPTRWVFPQQQPKS